MSMLADRVDAVIGVDTHTDTHTAAIVAATGAVLATLTVESTEEGYGQLLDALLAHAPGPRVAWAIEGTASYGSGLSRELSAADAEVIEIRAAARARGRAKNDTNDAVDMARTALSQDTHAVPRTGEIREALALLVRARAADVKTRTRLTNQLKALIVKRPRQHPAGAVPRPQQHPHPVARTPRACGCPPASACDTATRHARPQGDRRPDPAT